MTMPPTMTDMPTAGPSRPPRTSQHSIPDSQPRRSRSTSRPPPRTDGFDNYPPPLPSDPAQLERVLTEHPDIERQMAADEVDIGPPPDGGREAWCVVASTTFVLFCVHGLVTSFGVFQSYYLANQLLDYSRTQVAWISSVQLTLTFAFSIFGGRYFDAHGTKLLVRLGWCCSIGALIGLAFCTQYYQFMLAHTLFALSGSILYTPATAVVGHWFLRRRGTATGFVSMGVGLGGVIYPIMLNRLFVQIGFRNSILAVAGMNAALMTPALFFLRARLPPRTPPPLIALKRPFKDVRYTMMLVGSCVVMLNWFSPYFNAPLLLANHPTLAPYAVTFVQTGSLLGRAACGALADRLGVWRVFIAASALSGVAVLAFWIPATVPVSYLAAGAGVAASSAQTHTQTQTQTQTALAIVGLLIYGFTSGAWMTLVPPATAAISPIKELGMRTGMIWSASFAGLLAGPVVCGQLVIIADDAFTYAGAFCGITLILGSALTISPRAIGMIKARWSAGADGREGGDGCKGGDQRGAAVNGDDNEKCGGTRDELERERDGGVEGEVGEWRRRHEPVFEEDEDEDEHGMRSPTSTCAQSTNEDGVCSEKGVK